MQTICEKCGQPIQLAHKEHLNKQKLLMLKAGAAYVMQAQKNDFKKSDLADFINSPTPYTNWPKLRYHALIAKVKDKSGRPIKGRWLITRQGWAFLRGELELPKFVLIRNNHIIEGGRSPRLIGVRDVYRGSDIVETNFEYFDEDGHMVGVRPGPPRAPANASLF